MSWASDRSPYVFLSEQASVWNWGGQARHLNVATMLAGR
jgi:hypothetical protein